MSWYDQLISSIFYPICTLGIFAKIAELLCRQNFGQYLSHVIANLLRRRLASNIGRADTIVDYFPYSFFDSFCLFWEVERILQHHRRRKNGSDRIDLFLACDVRSRACGSS